MPARDRAEPRVDEAALYQEVAKAAERLAGKLDMKKMVKSKASRTQSNPTLTRWGLEGSA